MSNHFLEGCHVKKALYSSLGYSSPVVQSTSRQPDSLLEAKKKGGVSKGGASISVLDRCANPITSLRGSIIYHLLDNLPARSPVLVVRPGLTPRPPFVSLGMRPTYRGLCHLMRSIISMSNVPFL